MFAQLKDLQVLARVTENPATENPIFDNETESDEYEELINETVTELTPNERRIIILPSNGNVQTNASLISKSNSEYDKPNSSLINYVTL